MRHKYKMHKQRRIKNKIFYDPIADATYSLHNTEKPT